MTKPFTPGSSEVNTRVDIERPDMSLGVPADSPAWCDQDCECPPDGKPCPLYQQPALGGLS